MDNLRPEDLTNTAHLSRYTGPPSDYLISIIHVLTHKDPKTDKLYYRDTPNGKFMPLVTTSDYMHLSNIIDAYKSQELIYRSMLTK